MRRAFGIILAAALWAMSAYAQALIAPNLNVQFLDNSGRPLSAGRVYSCTAGAACPGTIQATFNSSSGFTANSNPIVLDAAGRASIWLTAGVGYRFVVAKSTGEIITGAGGDNIMGSPTSSSGGGGGGSPGGANTQIQYNDIGAFGADGNLTWNKGSKILTVTGTLGTPGIVSAGGFIQSSGGFFSTANSWQAFNTNTDGALLRGLSVAQNASNTLGGYINLAPVTYNPYGGSTCFDYSGNPVQQPLPLTGLSSYGTHNIVLWVGTSPQMPASGSCGAPLPIELDYGLNLNGYIFPRGGVATDNPAYNAINTIYPGLGVPAGGVTAGALIAGTLYPAGTVTSTTTLAMPAYLGGYVQVGHSATPPAAGTIAAVTNPLVTGAGLEQGTIYWDDALHCFNGYKDDATWACLSTVGGAGAGTVNSGVITQVAYYAATGAAVSGNAAFLWNPATPQVSLAGTFQTNGATYGFNASTCTATDCIQAALGSVLGNFVRVKDSLIFTEEVQPLSVSAANQCRIYDDSTLHTLLMSCDTGPYSAFGGGGGSGTVSAAPQFQMAYYPGAGTTTTVAGNAALLFNPATPQISFAGTYQTNGANFGFNASACNLTDCIQARLGGILGLTLRTTDSVIWTEESGTGLPLSAPGQSRMYMDNSSHLLMLSQDAHPYAPLGGSGGGTINVGGQFWIPYYSSGPTGTTVSGNIGFQYSPAANQVSLSGFFQANGATGGFNAPASFQFNAIQALNGGVLARNGTFQKYIQTGQNSGAPSMSPADTINPGTMYWDNSLSALRVWNGASYQSLSTGGISSINSLTGSLNITCNLATSCTITPFGTTIQISAPQPLGTASGVTFASVIANGVFNSTVIGANVGFQTSTGSFQVFGDGTVSAAGVIASTGVSGGINNTGNTSTASIQTVGGFNAGSTGNANGGYSVNGSRVINNSGQFIGAAVLTTGNVQTGGVFAVNGGFFGISGTLVASGTCTLFVQGGIIYSKVGC